jgi:hypothetical protein
MLSSLNQLTYKGAFITCHTVIYSAHHHDDRFKLFFGDPHDELSHNEERKLTLKPSLTISIAI